MTVKDINKKTEAYLLGNPIIIAKLSSLTEDEIETDFASISSNYESTANRKARRVCKLSFKPARGPKDIDIAGLSIDATGKPSFNGIKISRGAVDAVLVHYNAYTNQARYHCFLNCDLSPGSALYNNNLEYIRSLYNKFVFTLVEICKQDAGKTKLPTEPKVDKSDSKNS